MPFKPLGGRRRVPFIPQLENVECGAASLAMVLAYHGRHAPLSEVREACAVSRDGATAEAIVQAARAYGLEAAGVRAGLENLHALPLPAIVHWGARHFVVLERVSRGAVIVMDPSRGRRRVKLAELGEQFTGVALVLRPGKGFEARRRTRPTRARYWSMFRKVLPSLGQVLVASVLLQVVMVIFPVATQFLLDRVIVPGREPWLWALGAALAATALVRIVLNLVRGWALQGLQVVLDFELMAGLLDHLLHLPASYFLQRRAGDLAQRVEGATVVRSLITSRAASTLLDTFQLVGYVAVMTAYSPRVSAAVLAVGAARLAVLGGLRHAKRQLMTMEQAALGRESAALVEAFSDVETTKACGAEGYLFGRWAARTAERIGSNLPRQNLELASARVMTFLQTAGLAFVFWLGGHEVIAERMTVGTFAALLTLQGLVLAPLESLVTTFDQLRYLDVQLMRVDDVFEVPREQSGSTAPEQLRGEIDVKDVTFSYSSGGPPALQGVSLGIAPGRTVALVGPNGSGKSTLARLLLGMYRPATGSVLIDGHDLRELDLAWLRGRMGVVLQETFLFDATVHTNMCLGHPDASLEAVRKAAWRACIDDVVEALPEGYDTPLGQNGARLSAGQRQRVALARALVHEPGILLLDEATSALDLETEARVFSRLRTLPCTCIVVTHRAATVSHADQVVVLDRGRIVQVGRHETLLGEPGLFRDLVAAVGPPKGARTAL